MASNINITMDQGTTFISTFNIVDGEGNPLDLSTYTGSALMRKTYMSVNSYTFGVTTGSNGNITLTMSANTTRNIWPGRYVYDIDVTSSNNIVSRVVQGIVTVTPSVTDNGNVV